jgi:hypothetical protein
LQQKNKLKKNLVRNLRRVTSNYNYALCPRFFYRQGGKIIFYGTKRAAGLRQNERNDYRFGALLRRSGDGKFLALDVANGLLAVSAPRLFGFSENKRARNFFSSRAHSASQRDCFHNRRK